MRVADFFNELDDSHISFIKQQSVFFVSTSASEGRINLSPKGYDCFRILGPTRVGYLDLAGSGNETQAHLNADGRITIMFCNFQSPPLIMRLYGQGKSIMAEDADWNSLAANFTLLPGTRQIFDIQINSVQTSCGYGVPNMELKSERTTLLKSNSKLSPEAWLAKQAARNQSIDGLAVTPPSQYFGPEPDPEQ
jgi:hypothetical protein